MSNKTIKYLDNGDSVTADSFFPDGRQAGVHIARFGRWMAHLCLLMIVGAVLYLVMAIILAWSVPSLRTSDSPAGFNVAMFLIWVVSLSALVWGLWNGRVCFLGLTHGDLFTRRTIKGLRNFAFGLFIYKAVPVLAMALMILVHQLYPLPVPANTGITIQDFGQGLFTLVSLGAIVVIAAVLTRAAEIAEDNANIV